MPCLAKPVQALQEVAQSLDNATPGHFDLIFYEKTNSFFNMQAARVSKLPDIHRLSDCVDQLLRFVSYGRNLAHQRGQIL